MKCETDSLEALIAGNALSGKKYWEVSEVEEKVCEAEKPAPVKKRKKKPKASKVFEIGQAPHTQTSKVIDSLAEMDRQGHISNSSPSKGSQQESAASRL